MTVNDQYQYEPRLAREWTVSPDARVFTFNLRAAFAAGRATSDSATRMQAYQQLAHITNDEPSAIWAYSSKLSGFKAHGELTYGFWNAAEWSLTP